MFIFSDLVQSFQYWRIWLYSSWIEALLVYRHSVLGVAWLTLPILIVIGLKSFLFSGVFSVSSERYIPSLAFGMVFWRLISGHLIGGSTALTSNRGLLHQRHYPFFLFVFKNVVKCSFDFIFSFIAIFIVILFFHNPFQMNTILIVPALIILNMILIFVGFLLAILCCRFQDLQASLVSFMRVIFLLTPIIWLPEMAQGNRLILLSFNPFYHMLEMVRDPLVGQPIELANWFVSISILVIVIFLAAFLGQKMRRKPVTWI